MDPRNWPMVVSLAALACGLVAIGMGVVLLVDEDSGGGSADPETDRTATLSPATAGTSGTPVATGSAPASTPAIPLLSVGGDVSLDDDLSLLVGQVPFGKGGIAAWNVQRYANALPGGVGPAAIGGASPGDGPGLSFAQDETGAVFASICRPVACASEGFDPAESFTTTFYRSDDGGLTWREVASRSGQWFVRAAVANEPIAVSFVGPVAQWVRAVSNQAIARPPNAGELDLVSFRGQIAWIHQDVPVVVSESGSTLYKLDAGQPLTARIQSIAAPLSGGIAVLWADSADAGKRYLTTDTGRGEFFQTIEVGDAIHAIYGFASGGSSPNPRLLVSGYTGARSNRCPEGQVGHGASPAILEPAAGYVYFIRDMLVSEACPQGGTVAFAFWSGSFERVEGTGSCLNVREEPSLQADIVECFGDGALLELVDSVTEIGGIRWQAVVTASGQDGWAAEEFLTR